MITIIITIMIVSPLGSEAAAPELRGLRRRALQLLPTEAGKHKQITDFQLTK